MENRTMMQPNDNTYNSDNSRTQMWGSSECVSVYVSELRQTEAQMKLSEENRVWCRCWGMYRELERRSVSGMSRWTYSVGGIGEQRCPLTESGFPLISIFHSDIIKAPADIQLCEVPSPLQFVDKFWNFWPWLHLGLSSPAPTWESCLSF